MSRSSRRCPSFEELLARLAGADASGEVAAHVASGCRACAERLTLLERLRAAFARGPLPAVPERLSAAARALAVVGGGDGRGLLGRVRELVAQKLLDTSSPELVPALRDAATVDRHQLYAAGTLEVDLALVESGALVGQVLADLEDEPLLAGAVCTLLGDGEAREAPLLPNGDFRFEAVGAGRYSLVVESEHLRVLLPEVDLTPPP